MSLRDAATVVLLREAADAFEVFLVRRHGRSGFMAGAHVFPGGKLDEADGQLTGEGRSAEDCAEALGEPGDPRRALGLFVAAARETFEEACVLLATVEGGTDLEAERARLEGGEPFAGLLARLGLGLRLDWLTPLSRWITPEVEPRRYDTRFFLAVQPPSQAASHDRRETTEALWIRPGEAVGAAARGELLLPPPTLRTLELLAPFASAAAAIAAAASRPPPLVRPVFEVLDDEWTILLPGDPRHPEPEPTLEGASRIVLVEGRWRSRDRTT